MKSDSLDQRSRLHSAFCSPSVPIKHLGKVTEACIKCIINKSSAGYVTVFFFCSAATVCFCTCSTSHHCHLIKYLLFRMIFLDRTRVWSHFVCRALVSHSNRRYAHVNSFPSTAPFKRNSHAPFTHNARFTHRPKCLDEPRSQQHHKFVKP